ncbi:MAG: response regulator [Desulfohalobiaceae bacterium]|nr:response regulator [Desulfohalobiaceae bacterium]
MIRYTLSQFFTLDGYSTSVAENGKDGFRMYQDHPADLIVTDMLMPEMDGIETISAVRKENPEAKIIAISSGGRDAPEDYLVLAEHLGADRTFCKPVERAELVAAAREMLG